MYGEPFAFATFPPRKGRREEDAQKARKHARLPSFACLSRPFFFLHPSWPSEQARATEGNVAVFPLPSSGCCLPSSRSRRLRPSFLTHACRTPLLACIHRLSPPPASPPLSFPSPTFRPPPDRAFAVSSRTTRPAKAKALAVQEQQASGGGLSEDAGESEEEWKQDEEDEEDVSELAAAEEDEEYTPKPKKKKGGAKSKGKGKEKMQDQGKLQQFVAMPMDLLAEVCAYLDPIDLLHLSRSSRQFRSVFFRASSAPLWRAARKNVGLPDLEIPMAEPAYASLMLEKFCMNCEADKPHTPKIDYYLRRRFCASCAKKQFTALDSLKPVGQISVSIVKQCFASTPRNPPNGSLPSHSRFTLTETIPAVLDKLKTMSKGAFASMLQGKGTGSATLTGFLNECKAETALREKDGKRLHDWADKRAVEAEEKKDREEEEKCFARKKALEEKFMVEGWNPLEFEEDEWNEHELVFCPTKLTPQNWKKVKPELEQLLASLLSARLVEEADERRQARIDRLIELHEELKAAQPDDYELRRHIFPEVNLFASWKAVSPLYEEDEELTDERWTAALPNIEVHLVNYREVMVDRAFYLAITTVIRARYADFGFNSTLKAEVLDARSDLLNHQWDHGPESPSPSEQYDFLASFTALFPIDCKGCHQSGLFPSFLGHSCHRDLNEHLNLIEVLTIDSNKVAAMLVLAGLAGVKKADELRGMDGKLDGIGSAFSCGACIEENGVSSEAAKRRFGWRVMVDHYVSVHPLRTASTVIRLASSLTEAVDLDLTLSSDEDGKDENEKEVKAEV